MPLYVGRIRLKGNVCEIPVWGGSEGAALEYLRSHRNWLDDDVVVNLTGPDTQPEAIERDITIVGVSRILDPRLSPFEGQHICWVPEHGEQISVGAAFHDEILIPMERELWAREDAWEERMGNAQEAGKCVSQEEVDAYVKEIDAAWDHYFECQKWAVVKFNSLKVGYETMTPPPLVMEWPRHGMLPDEVAVALAKAARLGGKN